MAEWYCREVVADRVPACIEEKQACQRFLNMLKQAQTAVSEFVYSPDHVVDFCAFLEELPHTKGFEGRIVCEPVQAFWAAGVFGFRERRTGKRWVRKAILWVPRKNTKTTFGAAVIMYCANGEGEPGAEVVISAGSEKQAHVPYDVVVDMIAADKELAEVWGAYTTNKFTEFKKTGSSILLATSKAENLDGFNPHLVFQEELHAQSIEVINVLESAQGARTQPLVFSISTAGRDVNSPAYNDWKDCQNILKGTLSASRIFTVMYAGDKDDDANKFDIRVVEKLNPMFGISVQETVVEEEQRKAKQSDERMSEYRRTRLNIWSRASGNLFDPQLWALCADKGMRLDTFRGFGVCAGLDLASHSDLNAACFQVHVAGCLFQTYRYWIPAESPRFSDDRYAETFLKWHEEGWLKLQEGNYADQEEILADILEMLEGHTVLAIGTDTYQHAFLSGAFAKKGIQSIAIPKVAKYLSRPTDDLVARHKNPKLLRHDGNPVTEWMAGNVVGRRDANDNVLPRKEGKMSGASIDGMDAAIMANGVRMHFEAGLMIDSRNVVKPNPFYNRGLIGAQ